MVYRTYRTYKTYFTIVYKTYRTHRTYETYITLNRILFSILSIIMSPKFVNPIWLLLSFRLPVERQRSTAGNFLDPQGF
jgi:hypothetical protein